MTSILSGKMGDLSQTLLKNNHIPARLFLDYKRMYKVFETDPSLREKWKKDVAEGFPYGEDRRYYLWINVFSDLEEGEEFPDLNDLNLLEILKLYQNNRPEFDRWVTEAENGNLYGPNQKYKL